MAEISRRAGVGMATLYRNFPGRRELLEALFTDEVDAIRLFAFFTSKQHIAVELLEHTESGVKVLGKSRARVIAAGRPLLAAAQRTGEVRDDLALEQILDMVKAIATTHGDPDYVKPILEVALDGLRRPSDGERA